MAVSREGVWKEAVRGSYDKLAHADFYDQDETMKVKDLIERLQGFDPDLLVICSTQNEADLDSGDLIKCFEIQGISKHVCTPASEEGRVTVALGKGKEARPVVFIELD